MPHRQEMGGAYSQAPRAHAGQTSSDARTDNDTVKMNKLTSIKHLPSDFTHWKCLEVFERKFKWK